MRAVRAVMVGLSISTAFTYCGSVGDVGHPATAPGASPSPSASSGSGQTCTTVTGATALNWSGGKELGFRSSTFGGDELAQTFKVATTRTYNKVSVILIRQGNPLPPSMLTLRIQADNSGQPDGTTLGGGTLTVASAGTDPQTGTYPQSISKSAATYSFNLSSEVTLTESKTYWLRIQADFPASDSDTIKWLGEDGTLYVGGAAYYETSTENAFADTLIGSARDLTFEVTGQNCN